MALRLILGRAGSGKSSLCLEEIRKELDRSPRGASLIYLVPEQATFQAEHTLVRSSPTGGTIRAQVLSFRRLAWRVLQETGGQKRIFLDDTGKSMLLKKALEHLHDNLKIFKGTSQQKGAVESLLQFYNELKRSNITLGRLRALYHTRAQEAADTGSSPFFRDKLEDLLLLFSELESNLQASYLDKEDYLALLILKVPLSAFLNNAVIWVDGFHSFTNQEYSVLEKLMQHCSLLNVALCLDRDCPAGEEVDQMDPFYPAAHTCSRLRQLAQEKDGSLKTKILSSPEQAPFGTNHALNFLEQNLHRYPTQTFSHPYTFGREDSLSTDYGLFSGRSPLRLVSSPNRRGEVESMAREILVLVRDHGYRWRDIAVITGDLEQYRPLIASVLTDHQIPYFLDLERPARNHSLIEFVRSALEVVTRRWRYEDVFRSLKTDFPLPLAGIKKWRERVDQLENYVLAFGIQGERWLQEESWQFRKKDLLDSEKEELSSGEMTTREKQYLKQINTIRRRVTAPLIKFHKEIKGLSSVKDKCQALYKLLQEVEVQHHLEGWIKEAADKGLLQEAREHGQVYEGLLELLDQLVEILGEEVVTEELFGRLLEAGLDNLYFSLVPPSLDQVLIGSMERTRSSSVKCSFILGVNEGLIPSRPGEDEIFSEEERERLQGWGLDIPPGSRRQLLDEQFLIYMALTRASDELRLSYALTDEEGATLAPSLLIARIKELFPFLQEEVAEVEPLTLTAARGFSSYSNHLFEEYGGGDAEQAEEALQAREADLVLPFVTRPEKTFSHLLLQLNRRQQKFEIHPLWWEIYNWYAKQKEWHPYCKRLLQSIFYSNTEKPLDKSLSKNLYGSNLKTSVSRLEKYKACPFSHFASYGLGLKERQLYNLETPDLGRFFQASLRNIALTLEDWEKDWAELDREQSYSLAAKEVEKLIPYLQEEILLSSGRYRYLAEKIKRTVGRAVHVLGEHARRGSFKPVGVEVAFGEKGEMPAISFTLSDGYSINLEGRIDRVDLARDEKGNAFIRIIDYKSGGSELDLREVFYGISLQVMAYLDVILTWSWEWLQQGVMPAGVFYFRLYSPFLSSSKTLTPEEIEEKVLKSYKLKGRVVHDSRVARLMDGSLEKGYSSIIPIGLKNNDEIYEKSSTLSLRQFEQLRNYVRKITQEIATGIVSGHVDISPYRLGGKKPCTYCPYKPACQFDPLLEGNSFRYLQGADEKQLWSWIEATLFEECPGCQDDKERYLNGEEGQEC